MNIFTVKLYFDSKSSPRFFSPDCGEAIIFAQIGDATNSSSSQQRRGLWEIWGFCTALRKMT